MEEFLKQSDVLLDVRSPSEYLSGHIPGAIPFPLFSDDERAQVGTLYKQEGHDAAVRLGLKFVGPKLASFVELADQLAPDRSIRLYCWRGGMRSSSMAWLLRTAGFECKVLNGGFKKFKAWTVEQFTKKVQLIVLGGLTGSGKTETLQILKQQGEQVIDLEALANHQGSSFGHLRFPKQPTQEKFMIDLAWQLSQFDPKRPIWIEDESRMIGTCQIPKEFFEQMCHAPFKWIENSNEERIARLIKTYGCHPPEKLIESTKRLVKKLGAVRTEEAVQHIKNHNLPAAIAIILDYYDRTYTYGCQRLGRTID